MSIPVEIFFLDPGHGGTLQQQIQRMISEGILSGRFRPGDKLPSSRKFAEHLGISRMTITLAYNALLSDDYLSSKGRSGYYVSKTAPRRAAFDVPVTRAGDTVTWSRAIGQRYSGQIMPEKPPDWQDFPYPFIYGQTDDRIFDHSNWRQCALQAMGKREFGDVTADYFDQDDPELIKYVVSKTLPRRGILARPEEVLITMGAQNALWLSAQILLNQRRTAAMENPGYPGLRVVLKLTRCNVDLIGVDEGGMQFENLSRDVDVVFTTPSHHCPTNVTMPVDRRRKLLELASEHNFLIVEDDYEFEMSFLKPSAPALKSLDQESRVIYVGSYSKSLFPGLRLGYIVGAEPFIREARALRAAILRHPPGHIQRTVANFLSLGHYDALVARITQKFSVRRDVMYKALVDNGLKIAGHNESGGSSFWIKVDDGVDTRVLAQRLAGKGVLIEPGHVFFDQQDGENRFFRLAYSSIAQNMIEPGIGLIAEELRSYDRV